tara:strand:- start:137 stop:718 length:582 start_codon:yes stop_codon:yes gene_type:complete
MPVCVVVLKEVGKVAELQQKLKESSTSLVNFKVIKPSKEKFQDSKADYPLDALDKKETGTIPAQGIDEVEILNPKISRARRQKTLALWLMPFGFFAGATFTEMTNLQTFAKIGISYLPESAIGGILGLLSGLIGSFFAAGSVNSDKQGDLRILRKLNREGAWLVVLETPLEIELPWNLIKQVNPTQIVRLVDL